MAAQPLSGLLLWLLPVVFALHDAEETLFLPRWLRRNRDYLNRRLLRSGDENSARGLQPDGSAVCGLQPDHAVPACRNAAAPAPSATASRNGPSSGTDTSSQPCAPSRPTLRSRIIRRIVPHLFSVTRKQFAGMAAEELLLLLGVTICAAVSGNYYPWLAGFLAFGLHRGASDAMDRGRTLFPCNCHRSSGLDLFRMGIVRNRRQRPFPAAGIPALRPCGHAGGGDQSLAAAPGDRRHSPAVTTSRPGTFPASRTRHRTTVPPTAIRFRQRSPGTRNPATVATIGPDDCYFPPRFPARIVRRLSRNVPASAAP